MSAHELLRKVTVALLAYGPEGEELALCNQAMAAIQGEREREELLTASLLALNWWSVVRSSAQDELLTASLLARKWWTVVPGCSPAEEVADYAAFIASVEGRSA